MADTRSLAHYLGHLDGYKRLFEALEASGNNVEIRGKCLSACTLVLSYIPKERLCFHETAWLGFHLAGSFYGASTEVSQAMFDSYPQDIRKWLPQKGGLEKMPHGPLAQRGLMNERGKPFSAASINSMLP